VSEQGEGGIGWIKQKDFEQRHVGFSQGCSPDQKQAKENSIRKKLHPREKTETTAVWEWQKTDKKIH